MKENEKRWKNNKLSLVLTSKSINSWHLYVCCDFAWIVSTFQRSAPPWIIWGGESLPFPLQIDSMSLIYVGFLIMLLNDSILRLLTILNFHYFLLIPGPAFTCPVLGNGIYIFLFFLPKTLTLEGLRHSLCDTTLYSHRT